MTESVLGSFTISEEDKEKYAGLFVLNHMINKPATFSVMLEGDLMFLQPVLEKLHVKNYVEVKRRKYVPTKAGREKLELFLQRFTEFNQVFDIYMGVDLYAEDECERFALSRYFEYLEYADKEGNNPMWEEYIRQDRWEDLRIAVASFKGMDPVEIVVMSFMQEGRYGSEWEFDLIMGGIWDEILAICNTATQAAELGDDIMEALIKRGFEEMKSLYEKELEINAEAGEEEYEEEDSWQVNTYVETVVVEPYPVYYYDPWYDPYYRPSGVVYW